MKKHIWTKWRISLKRENSLYGKEKEKIVYMEKNLHGKNMVNWGICMETCRFFIGKRRWKNPPAPKVLGRDLPDGTRKRLQVYLGGGIFRPKPPVLDRSWRLKADPFSDWFSSFCDSRNTGFYTVFLFSACLTASFKTSKNLVNYAVLCYGVNENIVNTSVFFYVG